MKRRYWISVPGLNVKHDKDNEDTKEAIEKIFQEQLRYRTKPNDNS